MDFKEFILKMVMWLITEQFDFSLDRMTFGQKAKFILSKSEFFPDPYRRRPSAGKHLQYYDHHRIDQLDGNNTLCKGGVSVTA